MRRFFFIIILILPVSVCAQYLSNLNATKRDPLFTTYAAPLFRSEYKLDQGYQFQWFDPQSGVELVSKEGPNLGIAFSIGDKIKYRLDAMYCEPVVKISYSDLLRYVYKPFPELMVEVTFVVFNSRWSFAEYKLTNTGKLFLETGVHPYLYYPTGDSTVTISPAGYSNLYTFGMYKPRDRWMVQHNLPLVEHIQGYFFSTLPFDSSTAFLEDGGDRDGARGEGPFRSLRSSFESLKRGKNLHGIIGSRSMRIAPGESTTFRIMVGLETMKFPEERVMQNIHSLENTDVNKLIREDEHVYAAIPRIKFENADKEMLYWSSFSLLRQCMMPPEGSCNENYYVFSREPVWGWGYGGQVFHESLCMLAYAYMDPEGAMNSQRVFMDRQQPDGYINYRTGPYLDEIIETNGRKTTSAPWYSYENLEIYKITGDRKFLQEAYQSGKKFYQFYIANRDSNSNGLCEWGAHAELESVRDARVAVWDKVGWASKFEGPDLNSMLVKEARSLQEMAFLLDQKDEAAQWKKDADRRSELINAKLWDPQSGFYYNIDKRNQSFTHKQQDDLKVKEIIGFLPLWAGVSDSLKSVLLVRKMVDTSEFWRPYGVPSLSARNDYYCPIGYWNGPVWVQWDYLLFRGLLDHGYSAEAAALSDKVLDNMIYFLKKDHVFWEFYSPDDRQAGWNKTYIWAGIAPRFFIDLSK